MGGKSSGRTVAYPGANLAKGWGEIDDRERATLEAGQKLLRLIDQAFIYCSRRRLHELTIALAQIALYNLDLEAIRAQIIQLEEDLGL